MIRDEGSGEVTVGVRVDKGSNFSVTLRSTDTIKTLRQEVADKYGRPMNYIRVIHGSTELKGDKTLKEAKINNNTQLIARAKVTDITKPVSQDEKFAEYVQEITIRSLLTQILELQLNGLGLRSEYIEKLLHTTDQTKRGLTEQGNLAVRIMGKQKNFQRLFKLLNLQGDIAGHAWDLLNILPNSTMIEEFENTDKLKEKLESYLDPAVILKLAYSLNMISTLTIERQENKTYLPPNNNINHDSQDNNNNNNNSPNLNNNNSINNKDKLTIWINQFLELNGIFKLLDTLLDIPVSDSSAHITCFNQLLRLINYFIECQNKNPIKTGKTINEYEKLDEVFHRILSISYTLTLKQKDNNQLDNNEENKKKIIIGSCIHFIMNSIIAKNHLLTQLYNWENLTDWLKCCLLECLSKKIRQETSNELETLCKEIENKFDQKLFENDEKQFILPSKFFLLKLLDFLNESENYPNTSDYYFNLLEKIYKLLSLHHNNNKDDDDDDFYKGFSKKLVLKLIDCIKSHKVLEENENMKYKDTSLIGLFDFLRCIIRSSIYLKELSAQNSLLNELFKDCLFAIPSADNHGPDAPPKCKTKDSRYSAYRLLVELCRDVPNNFTSVSDALLKNMKNVHTRNNWQIIPGAKDKQIHGYVGLENLGATCYMNSLMQQLYCIPEFRYYILSVKDQSPDIDDSPLYQLQYMFAYLQETLKGSYTPNSFCSSYKDFDGNPVNVRIQMDANEFFNTLFDKLETLLAPTPRPNLLKQLFGGVISNQIISQECEHVSENIEDFYTVGVEMKNKKDIYSSFELFIECETIDSYHCDLCDKKVTALKRACLKSLPKVLLIQLKRFEFDLQTMQNKKINDE